MLGIKQAIRIIRTKWPNANMLAEELFAIFQRDIPLFHDAPITITTSTPEPPLTLQKSPDSNQYIQFINGDGDPIGGIGEDEDGNPELQDENGDPITPEEPDPEPEPEPAAAGGGIPGKIVAHVSGSDYSVELYENGPTEASTQTVTVRQLQIASGETIPLNTWTVVAQQTVGETTVFTMQVPVWLA